MNLTDAIWRNAKAFPQRIALHYQNEDLSYQQLVVRVESAMVNLRARGVRRGDVVALSMRHAMAYVLTLLALARLGACGAVIKDTWPAERKEQFLADHNIKLLIQHAGDTWRSSRDLSVSYLLGTALFSSSASAEPTDSIEAADLQWMLFASSGTTGTPKIIPETHRMRLLRDSLGFSARGDGERVLVLNDLAVYYGINTVIRALRAGYTAIVTLYANLPLVLAILERTRATTVIATPAVMTGFMAAAAQHAPGRLVHCEHIESVKLSGSAVSPGLRQFIEERICPTVEVSYGSTEAGLLATIDRDVYQSNPECHGRIRPWVLAEAVDEHDAALPAGQVGLLRFYSPLTVSGYASDPVTTAHFFRGGWFYPGDRGSVDSSGYLRLTGRADHVLNIDGEKIDPGVIEDVLNAYPGIIESAAIVLKKSGSHTMRLCAVVVATGNIDWPLVQEHCRARLDATCIPQEIILRLQLPKNAGGKIRRDALQEEILALLKNNSK